jgi:transposase
MEAGTPFSLNLVALAIYLRVIHAVSYRRLSRLFTELFSLAISEGALDAAFRRAKPGLMPVLEPFSPPPLPSMLALMEPCGSARLRRARVVCSDETSVRINGRTH